MRFALEFDCRFLEHSMMSFFFRIPFEIVGLVELQKDEQEEEERWLVSVRYEWRTRIRSQLTERLEKFEIQ